MNRHLSIGLLLTGLLAAPPVFAASNDERLIAAARDGIDGTVSTLLAAHADVNARDDTGATALAWAVLRNNAGVASRLLKAHANPNLADANGVTPLMLAIEGSTSDSVRQLLAAGADPNLARPDGETPLMTAVRVGSSEIAGQLLARKVQVNAVESQFHQTALMWAVGHPDIVRQLLAQGADKSAATKVWKTVATNYTPVVSTIGNTGIPWNYDSEYEGASGGFTALIFAAQKGDVESAKLLLDAGTDVNQAAADGTTALLASLYRFLPNSAAQDRNQRGIFGGLRFAADFAMAKLLLDRGAKPNSADRAGYTPLHGAVLSMLRFNGRGEIIIGFDGDKRNQPNAPPPQPPANEADGLAMAKQLLDLGADPNAATCQTTPGPLGAVKVNPAPPGSTPYHLAGKADSAKLVELLAAHGADANKLRKDGHTPLTLAIMSNDLPVVQAMAAHGANAKMIFNPSDKIADPVKSIAEIRGNETALHIAAISGADYVVPFLAAQGVPPDARNDHGETALDLADAQERFRYGRAKEAAGNMDRKGTEIMREIQTSEAFKKLSGKGKPVASN
jgi:ankyrin repeat protein